MSNYLHSIINCSFKRRFLRLQNQSPVTPFSQISVNIVNLTPYRQEKSSRLMTSHRESSAWSSSWKPHFLGNCPWSHWASSKVLMETDSDKKCIHFSYVTIPFKTIGPIYDENVLNSVVFHSFNSSSQQYVLGLPGILFRLYPHSRQKKLFFTSINTIFIIITYTHPFHTF